MRTFRPTRRQFLAGSAAGLGGLFLPSVLPAGSSAPRRLIFFYTLQGTVHDNWKMRPYGEPEDQDWEFSLSGLSEDQFSEILRPLYGLRDKLVVVDGLALATAMKDINFGPHALGQNHSLTGANIHPVSSLTAVATAPSVDQIIADAVRVGGQWTSLQFTTQGYTEAGCIYGLNNEPLHLDNEPQEAWERIFDQVTDTALFGNNAEVLAAQQPTVLEAVAARYEALSPRMSALDRQKLDRHRDLIRDTQQRLANPIECSAGVVPESQDFWANLPPEAHFDLTLEVFSNMMATALSCDMTRVASIQLVTLPSEIVNIPNTDMHNGFAHDVERLPSAKETMTLYSAQVAQRFRDFCELLDGIPEGGGSLLDNSLVVWLGELGDGAHNMGPWPVVIAGSGGGVLPTGRYIRYAPTTPIASTWLGGTDRVGPPHNKFLVSLAQMMGLDINSVGLTGIYGDGGAEIDLTGPLPGLLG